MKILSLLIITLIVLTGFTSVNYYAHKVAENIMVNTDTVPPVDTAGGNINTPVARDTFGGINDSGLIKTDSLLKAKF